MKRSTVLLPLVLIGMSVSGCADSGSTPRDRTASNSVHIDTSTIDYDTPNETRHDKDDDAIEDFGKAADAAEEKAVASLVKRYYAAAAEGDGNKGCTMLFSLLAESVVPDFGEPPGPPALRGKTCGAVLSKIFKQRHRQFVADSAMLRVVGVRIMGKQGYALLKTAAFPRGSILLRRERTVWKLGEFGGGGVA
jgi:hypothetical protein